jgi:hypothetical protein
VVVGVTSAAQAQDFEAAGKHFSAAQEAFGARHYRSAASEFEAAYGITKDPVLLYNIGESWEKAGDGRKAVASFKQYLKDQANAADKVDVQRRIKAIEAKKLKLVDQSAPGDGPPAATTMATTLPGPETSPTPPTPPVAQASTPPPSTIESGAPPLPTTPTQPPPAATMPSQPPPAAPVPPPSEAPPPGLLDEGPVSKMRVAAWIGVASTLALLTAGAIFGLAAQSRSDEINRRLTFVGTDGQPHKFDQSAQNDLTSLHDDGVLYNNLAITFYTLTAASAITTVALFVVDAKRPHPSKHAWRLSPVAGKNVGGLMFGGAF